MSAKPKFAHVVYLTAQGPAMRDWYCTVLDGHVVFSDATLTFITFDDEHHRVALIHPPMPMTEKKSSIGAMHHTAYTFANLDDLLDRYVKVRDRGIVPAVCIAHGITSSMYYKDPDGNFVELQIDRFPRAADATAYMLGPEFAADPVGPAFDPEKMLAARRAGASAESLCDRSWCVDAGLGNPMAVLMG